MSASAEFRRPRRREEPLRRQPSPPQVGGGELDASGTAAVLTLQRLAGNARVSRALAPPVPRTARRLVRRGDRGSRVSEVQRLLNVATPAPEPPLDVDGAFGRLTEAAVRAFQRHNGLSVDGIVGPETRGVLTRSEAPALQDREPGPPATSEGPRTARRTEAADAPKGDADRVAAGVVSVVERAIASLEPADGDLPADFVTTELNVIFERFAKVSVVVRGTAERAVVPPRTVTARTPYYINVHEGSAALSKRVAADARAARGRSPVKKFFRHVASRESGLHRALIGKATPEMIRQIAQSALDQGLIQPQDATHPTGDEVRSWLRTHGVGVDCSGFVSQALTHVMDERRRAAGLPGPATELRRGSGRLKGGTRDFAEVGVDTACQGPKCLAPGDTMYLPGHIRILATVEQRAGGVEFTTFESRAGGKERVGMAEVRWRFPDQDRFAGLQVERAGGTWRNAGSRDRRAVYGRYRGLTDTGE